MRKSKFLPFLSLCLALVLALGVTPFASATMATTVGGGSESEVSPSSAQLLDGKLYIIADGLLQVYDELGGEARTVLLDLSEVWGQQTNYALLTSDGTDLFVLYPPTGEMTRFVDGKLEPHLTLDVESLGEEFEPGKREITLMNPIVTDDALLALYMDPMDYYTTPILRFSLADGSMEKLQSPPVRQIAPYKQGQLLGMEFDLTTFDMTTKPRVLVLDAKTGAQVSQAGNLDSLYDGGLAYDAQNDIIYGVTGSELVRIGTTGNTPVNYMSGSMALNANYAGVTGDRYVLSDYTGVSVRGTDPSEMPENPLRIMGMMLNNTLAKDFMAANPDIPVVEQTQLLNESQSVIDSIVSTDSNVDIYVLNSTMNISGLIQKGYLEPIESPLLEADLAQMYPQIQEVLTRDGKVYGYPQYMQVMPWSVREDLLEEFGFEMPTSLAEYYRMMARWEDEYADTNTDYTFDESLGGDTDQLRRLFAINTTFSQYIMTYETPDAPLTFDTPQFREVLEAIEELPYDPIDVDAANMISNINMGGEQKSIFNSYAFDVFDRYSDKTVERPKTTLMPPPPFAEGDDPQLQAIVYFMAVNPNSKNKEAAQKFLEYACEHMATETKYLSHPDFNEPTENKNYEKNVEDLQKALDDARERLEAEEGDARGALEDSIAQMERALSNSEEILRWEFSAEGIAGYRAIAPYMNLMENSTLLSGEDSSGSQEVISILERYLAGQMSMDQALRDMDGKLRMMYQESR